MGKPVELDVDGVRKLSTLVDYNDLIILYKQFIEKYGFVPREKELNSNHNMPQIRIVNKVLNKNSITYNDFINQFGKVKHVRTEDVTKYNEYIKKFKMISNELGRALKSSELTNNSYGLPSASWFIKYCPDKSINSYSEFCNWCGYKDNSLKLNKDFVDQSLIDLQNKLGRPITKNDISLSKTGFSMIVINRLYNGLNNAKIELGLLKTEPNKSKSFDYYKTQLENTLNNIYTDTKRKIVSWKDIENKKYGNNINHKTYLKSFRENNEDIYKFARGLGFSFGDNIYSVSSTFKDGERVMSILEYDFSTFLKEEGYVYNVDYCRDVKYRDFAKGVESKINCDYVINGNKYIEVAGMIHRYNDTWDTYNFSSNIENEYRDKMILKRQILEDNHLDYLFLFEEDFIDGSYVDRFDDFIKEKKYA